MEARLNNFWLTALAALLTLASPCAQAQSKPSSKSKLHTYFIAADEVDWDYTPRRPRLTGTPHLE